MSTSSERQQRMMVMIHQGATFAQMGRELGVSGERARQLLEQYGLSAMRREATQQRHRAAQEAKREQLRQRLLATGQTQNAVERRLVRQMGLTHLVARPGHTSAARIWSDDQIYTILRMALQRAGGAYLSVPIYQRQRQIQADHGVRWPTAWAIMRRWRTWASACDAAGVPHGADHGPPQNRVADDATIKAAVVAYATEALSAGVAPTGPGLAQWLRDNKAGYSIHAVRARLGRITPLFQQVQHSTRGSLSDSGAAPQVVPVCDKLGTVPAV